MKTWKHWYLAAIFLLAGGTFYLSAQDMIILKDGNMIEAKVEEISSLEIRYKRFDHLDGPTIVVPAANVLSIKYENGNYEIINPGTAPQTEKSENTTTNTNKFRFGINANAGGALGYIWEGPTGAGINIELGKGKFNSEINLMLPVGGFGILATFNGFWPSSIGGFYLGGGIGFAFYQYYDHDGRDYETVISGTIGLNIGYKFVTKSGLYFRTGSFLGFDFGRIPVYLKPDLAIGWTMK
jgi:hypothetical protein